jgi:sigma-B regulation protein RsbU (phosphoserine phosphatase)
MTMKLSERMPVNEITFLDKEAQNFIGATGQSLSGHDDADAALTQALIQVTEFLGAEEGSIFLVDEPTGDLVLSHAAGEVGGEIIGLRLQSGQGVVGWVVKYSEDLIVPYPGLDERFFEGVDKRTGFSTRSILCGPIQANGKTIGAIEILNKRMGTFNDDDLVVLRAICRIVADVIPRTAA